MNEKLQSLSKKLSAAKEPKDVVAILDREMTATPALESRLGAVKFNALVRSGETMAALAYGNRLVGTVYKDDAQSLNSLAWGIVDPKASTKATPEMAQLGLKAARKADALSLQKDAAIADTLAAAHFASGDASNALKTEERAVTLAKGTAMEKNPSLVASLEHYRSAAAEAHK